MDRFSKSSQFIITTFRPKLLLQALQHATYIIGLRFDDSEVYTTFKDTFFSKAYSYNMFFPVDPSFSGNHEGGA